MVHDKAGERILEGLVADAQERLREEGISGDVYLFKNNTDSAGNSYGCHENYLVSRHGDFQRLSDVLIPFLVSRQIIAGAGKVLQTPRGAVYCVSQRADHIWEGVGSATTRSRPIINTRDEPHADAEKHRRLHVIVGDSNMSETTTMLKVGSTDLVLQMIEAGVVVRDLTLENPIRAIREISHDMTGRRKVRLANGREPVGAGDPDRVPRAGDRLRGAARGDERDAQGGARPVAAHADRGRDRRPVAGRAGDRLGDEVPPRRALPRQARARAVEPAGGPARPRLPRHPPSTRALLPAAEGRPGRAGRDRPRGVRGQVGAAADDAGQGARRLRAPRSGAAPRLHRRLGAPQA
ncbi:hypothetical protein GCM10025868_00290 [Angustibacter aerolatus]|uniref:Pup--protein ligase n=1 Tax=Angustibacter aerolatus TaxID=1162965 RepID=A0ABQ6JAG3_9ACTN|nr:hypothetical protein GCM10025868_00290 [Angustibacter aerolatus]